MFDPVAQAMNAVSSGSVYAFPFVFAAGALSSVGPCTAPRFMAVAGLASHRHGRSGATLVGAFVGGVVVMYASFGAFASLLGRAVQFSTWVYSTLALALMVAGAVSLWKSENACSHEHTRSQSSDAGATFFLGATSALVISPCCTPLVFGILRYTSAAGDPVYGSALLASFALGHALPILTVGASAGAFSALLTRYAVRRAAAVLSAALMLALGAYYAVLA